MFWGVQPRAPGMLFHPTSNLFPGIPIIGKKYKTTKLLSRSQTFSKSPLVAESIMLGTVFPKRWSHVPSSSGCGSCQEILSNLHSWDIFENPLIYRIVFFRIFIKLHGIFNMLEENKKNAVAFYKMAYEGNPREAVGKFVGDVYIQHNPLVGNGPEPLIKYFERMAKEYPEKSIEFVRVIAEDDLVALHTHQTWPGNVEYVTIDFFRFDGNGKIVEHWDSIQQIPEKSANENTMY